MYILSEMQKHKLKINHFAFLVESSLLAEVQPSTQAPAQDQVAPVVSSSAPSPMTASNTVWYPYGDTELYVLVGEPPAAPGTVADDEWAQAEQPEQLCPLRDFVHMDKLLPDQGIFVK